MKTLTIPSLRVTPEFLAAAESVLCEGETPGEFVEESMQPNIRRRQVQQESIACGLAAREEARRAGAYASKDEVLDSLRCMLDAGPKC